MSNDVSFVWSLYVQDNSFDKVEDKKIEGDKPAKEMIIVILQLKQTGSELRLVDIIVKLECSSMSDRGQDGSNSVLVHTDNKVNIGVYGGIG